MASELIIGIDLGTTNSEVALIRDSRPVVLEEDGDPILPSVVGLDPQGRLLVGKAARNQFVLAPERTIRSVKRKMGQEITLTLGDQKYTPQEISAIILRTLKQRAERAVGAAVSKVVITVPAFFNDGQRRATRAAGELAGLEVVRIINEPTAAVLTYDPHPPESERLLVYDLGGGTFDVSVAQVEKGVVEILASHGDTQLGGDDFDQLLLDHVTSRFAEEHGIDLTKSKTAMARLLRSVEEAKKHLSFDAVSTIEEEFIAEKDGKALNLVIEIERSEYEQLIRPLLLKTLSCLDKAMSDAKLQANQIDKVILVGGATRTPLIHQMLGERLSRPIHSEVEPDLAVAMGAAVQGGLIAGVDVGPILVDITPHTLGISALDRVNGFFSPHHFSPIIERNTPLPASRTEIYSTVCDEQDAATINVFQGENEDTRYNDQVGEFQIEGLAEVPAGNQILVRLDLDLSGILKVTATERATGLAKHVVIDNAMERFRLRERTDAVDRLEAVFATAEDSLRQQEAFSRGGGSSSPAEDEHDLGRPASDLPLPLREVIDGAEALLAKAKRILPAANAQDADELQSLTAELVAAVQKRDSDSIRFISRELEDLVFYLQDA
jgi:molecular chaperone DnaK